MVYAFGRPLLFSEISSKYNIKLVGEMALALDPNQTFVRKVIHLYQKEEQRIVEGIHRKKWENFNHSSHVFYFYFLFFINTIAFVCVSRCFKTRKNEERFNMTN